ncbi:hypothetical protein ALT785_770186 [Alteromonas infernus]
MLVAPYNYFFMWLNYVSVFLSTLKTIIIQRVVEHKHYII